MNIIIAGDGEVGFYLAKSLTELGHNLTVVDPNSDLLKRLESESDLMTQVGDAHRQRCLKMPEWSSATSFWPCCTRSLSTSWLVFLPRS